MSDHYRINRYLVTGTQLGMIKGLLSAGQVKCALRLIDEIIVSQDVFGSKDTIDKDVLKLRSMFE